MKWFGFALALLGAALLYGGLGYNRQVAVVELEGVRVTAREHRPIPYAPLIGGLVLIGGAVLLLVPRTRRA